MQDASAAEKLDVCRKILNNFGTIARHTQKSPDRIKLRQEVSDFITSTPGHAYEMKRRMLRRVAINRKEIEGEYSHFEYDILSRMIGELKSVETIRVLSEFLPEMMTSEEVNSQISPGINTGLYAANNLYGLLENPPVEPENTWDKEAWLQWKKEIENGSLYFQIKGIDGVYNFDGPVPKKPKRGHAALASQNVTTNSPKNQAPQNPTDSTSQLLTKSIWFYLIPAFAILAGCWFLYHQRKTS